MSDTYATAVVPILALGDDDHGVTTLVRALRVRLSQSDGAVFALTDTWAYGDVVRGLATGAYREALALLVVSAAVGLTPRASLLLRMLQMRRFRHVVVALTFADAVDDDRLLSVVQNEVRTEVTRFGYTEAPVIVVDSFEGEAGVSHAHRSLDRCIAALTGAVKGAQRSEGAG